MDKFGLNIRASSGFVSDGTDDTYCLVATDGTSGDSYPTTRGGLTFGATSTFGPTEVGRDRNSGINAKLAGIVGVFSGSTGGYNLRVDKTGSLKVRVALGDDADPHAGTLAVKDSAGTKFTVAGTTAGAARWFDATQTERTSAADWVSNNAQSAAYTFADYVLFDLDWVSGVVATLSHVEVEEQGGAAAASRLTLLGVG